MRPGAPLDDDPLQALAELVEHAHSVAPAQLGGVVRQAAAHLGAADVEVLLVDYGQEQLAVLEDGPVDRPRKAPVTGSTAGLAYTRCAPLITVLPDDGGTLVSAPLLDGVERLGVLQLTFPSDASGDQLPDHRRFADLVSQYLSTKGRVTDEYHRLRSAEPMSLAAQMQWQMLPPILAKTPDAVIAGQVEPAYHVGGDAFDYAFNHDRVHLAIFDAMGHGLAAGVTTALAMAAYRNSRRRGDDLATTLRTMDEAISGNFSDDRFVTALLAEFDTTSGHIAFLNAGHLQPLLLRGHRILPLPPIPAGLPLGLGGLLPPAAERVTTHPLQPGDRVLLVTDGILDATDATGTRFGEERLAALAERAGLDQLPLAELARSITGGVFDYQAGKLTDDASLLVLEYTGGDSTPLPVTAPEQGAGEGGSASAARIRP
jgi:phosphoserine phosphatase RsbU/P